MWIEERAFGQPAKRRVSIDYHHFGTNFQPRGSQLDRTGALVSGGGIGPPLAGAPGLGGANAASVRGSGSGT